jgi:hypothetical protein
MAWIWPQNPRRASPSGTLCTGFTDGTLSAMPMSNTILMMTVQLSQSLIQVKINSKGCQ